MQKTDNDDVCGLAEGRGERRERKGKGDALWFEPRDKRTSWLFQYSVRRRARARRFGEIFIPTTQKLGTACLCLACLICVRFLWNSYPVSKTHQNIRKVFATRMFRSLVTAKRDWGAAQQPAHVWQALGQSTPREIERRRRACQTICLNVAIQKGTVRTEE